MQRSKMLGISDEVTTCDCCGKNNLKRTVAIEMGDSETVVFYGVDCARRELYPHIGNARIQTIARNAGYLKPEVRQAFHSALTSKLQESA